MQSQKSHDLVGGANLTTTKKVAYETNTKKEMRVFPKIGVGPQNGWFIMENPIKMDDLGVLPTIFGLTPMSISTIQAFQVLKNWLRFKGIYVERGPEPGNESNFFLGQLAW